jgi:hypothetical protein
MPITLGTSTPVLAWRSARADAPYAWEYVGPGLIVQALDRATAGPEIRFTFGDGSTVAFRVAGVGGGLSPIANGNSLTFGFVSLLLQETADGKIRVAYDLTAPAKPSNNQVAWTVTTAGGASLVLLGDGTASLRDARGNEQATQPAPIATDKNGASVAVTATLANGTLTYTLANIATSRSPVTIDPTTVSTSTTAIATGNIGEHKVYVATDGTVLAFWFDGSDLKFSSSASPYASWSSSTTLATGASGPALSISAGASDVVDVLWKPSAGALATARLTKSGSTWTAGSPTTVVSADVQGGGAAVHLVRDGLGRMWAFSAGWSGSAYIWRIYYDSSAGGDGTAWTQSLASNLIPMDFNGRLAVVAAGTYLVALGIDGSGNTNTMYRTTSDGLTTWTVGASVIPPTYSNSDWLCALDDGDGDVVVVVAGSNAGTPKSYRYTPSTNTWSSSTTVGTGSNDLDPTLARVGTGLYCFWSEYAASNSYAIVYRVWDATANTWGSKATLAVSGSNRRGPSAGATSSAVGVIWTQGTASPYDVLFDSVSLAVATKAPPPFQRRWRYQTRRRVA